MRLFDAFLARETHTVRSPLPIEECRRRINEQVGALTYRRDNVTAFTGTFQINQQPVNGVTKFSQNYSFNGVPDGGSTMLLLGAAMSGLVLIRRKLNA